MKFPYAEKGCSNCDINQTCPKKLKRSKENMTREVRTFKGDDGRLWGTKCRDFNRLDAQEVIL